MKKLFLFSILCLAGFVGVYQFQEYQTRQVQERKKKAEQAAFNEKWNKVAVPVINRFVSDLACESKLKRKSCRPSVKREKVYKKALIGGKVTDEEGSPIENAQVTLSNLDKKLSFETNKDGTWGKEFEIDMVDRKAILSIKKTGYVPFFKVLNLNVLNKGQKAMSLRAWFVDESIVLKKAMTTKAHLFNTQPTVIKQKIDGSEKEIKLFIPTKSLLDENGEVATGEIQVQFSYLDLHNSADTRFLPTMTYFDKMQGVNLEGKIEAVDMPGVIFAKAYQLDEYGNPKDLTLKKGGWTILSFPRNESWDGQRYWHFDQETGLWFEEAAKTWINSKTNNWEVKTTLLF